ncbi:MAG: hypothetical protein COA91_09290 [Robiginitomaculum sp.]|nr:MAG: hypothetical protein COA91_09290 [Robiginitomaculum sp.]
MDDILHILDLLRQRAEADIRQLTSQKQKFLSQMSDITLDIEAEKSKLLHRGDGEDVHIFEKWRHNQIFKLTGMKKKLQGLDKEIALAKTHFKSILAKDQMLQQVVKQILRAEQLDAETAQTSEQLDVFLLRGGQ